MILREQSGSSRWVLCNLKWRIQHLKHSPVSSFRRCSNRDRLRPRSAANCATVSLRAQSRSMAPRVAIILGSIVVWRRTCTFSVMYACVLRKSRRWSQDILERVKGRCAPEDADERGPTLQSKGQERAGALVLAPFYRGRAAQPPRSWGLGFFNRNGRRPANKNGGCALRVLGNESRLRFSNRHDSMMA